MLNAKLGNEFGESTSRGKQRQEAFNLLETLIAKDQPRVVRVLASLAAGAAVEQSDQTAASAVHNVLNQTNHGTQIGFEGPDREQAWAIIFEDPDHIAARHRYAELPADHPEKMAAQRIRGYYTLRAYARAKTSTNTDIAQAI